jgi:tetratricopeptide (TPR) repeat protein
MPRTLTALLTIVGLASAGVRSAAAPAWVEIRSQHFTVLADGGEKTARSVAWQFEQIRTALQQGWPWLGGELDRPIVVVGAKDERSMRTLMPQYWEKGAGFHPVGVFVTEPDRYALVLQTDVRTDGPLGVNPYRQAYWQYGAVALESSGNRGLPLWFTSGFREIISNTNVIDTEVQFGRAIPDHYRRLQQSWPYTLDKLFQITSDSPEYRIEDRRWDYDAECWSLMQLLMFGGVDTTNRDANVNHLAQELLKGRSSTDVVTEVFGSVTKLENALHVFLTQGVSHYASVKVDAAINSKEFAAQSVSPGMEWTMRAALHAAMNRPADARAAIAEATKAEATLPGPHDVEGQLLERERKPDEARAAFEQAVAAGSTSFYTYYRLASLMWTSTAQAADLDKIEELSTRGVALNDAYAPAQDLLANIRLRLRKPGAAIGPATRAIQLRPDQPAQRLTLAEALFQMGSKADALKMAQSALAAAKNDNDRRRAQAAIERYSK